MTGQQATSGAIEDRARVPRLSVVIPTYNRSSFLSRCLTSLEGQSLRPGAYEVIVVDDGSTDDTPQICNTFRNRTTMSLVYIRGPHRGPASARNLGISRARGEIVAFVDDDCEARGDWLERLSAAFDDASVVGVEGKVTPHPQCTPFTHFVENLQGGLYLTANVAYRRAVLNAVTGFDESYPHAAAEDWDLAFRILELGGEIVFRPEAEVVHVPVPVNGHYFIERTRERRSALLLYRRFPERWRETTGRTMRRSFFESIFLGPAVEVRKWRQYFLSHFSQLPRFLFWQCLASSRLLAEYARVHRLDLGR